MATEEEVRLEAERQALLKRLEGYKKSILHELEDATRLGLDDEPAVQFWRWVLGTPVLPAAGRQK